MHDGVVFLTEDLEVGPGAIIFPGAILGFKNPDQSWFDKASDRTLVIGPRCVIMPHTLLYEGAHLKEGVILEERTTVGSVTRIGERTRLVFGAQVYHNVQIGKESVIGALIANNARVGSHCSVFGSLVHRYSGDSTKWNTLDEPGPILGDRVLIGMGAVVAGNIRIGRDCRVEPNSLVRTNLKAGTVFRNEHGRPD